MRTLVWSELRRHPGRFAGALLAIMISVGFVSATLIFVDTQVAAITASLTARTAGSNVIVDPTDEKSLTATIAATPGVETVEPIVSRYLPVTAGNRSARVELDSLARDQRLRATSLSSGRWPGSPTEVALSQSTAKTLGVGPGGSIIAQADRTPVTLQVVGITAEPGSLFTDIMAAGVVAPDSPVLTGGWPQYLVIARAGVSPDELAQRLQARLPAETTVQTTQSVADSAIADLTNGIDVIRIVLLSFGAIALLVGAIIISTTFAVVVAQRRRQIGLLRAVGADRGQIRRQLLVESLIIGILGSLLGLALGAAVAAIGSLITGNLQAGLVLRPQWLALAAGLGVIITLFAGMAPARQATRVSPLDALRPVADQATERRHSRVRAIVALAMIFVGTVLVIAAFQFAGETVLVAIAGSALLAVGILALAPVFLPPAMRLMARLLSRSRPTVRLAAANLVRNPARAATVATALMLGVGLIVTLQVGAASVKASAQASLSSEFPVDISLSSFEGALPGSVLDQVRSTPGVRAAVALPSAEVNLGSDQGSIKVMGLGPDAGTVVAAGLDQLDDRTALVHPDTMSQFDLTEGQQLGLSYKGKRITVTLKASDVAAQSGTLVVTAATLQQLDPNAPVRDVWAAAQPGTNVVTVMGAMQTIADGQPSVAVGGSLEQVAAIGVVLDALLLGATALTAVAVIIALVGMGTTLGLSVIERSRESALLRALGLQRSQLRSMLAIEAVLLAALGSLVGIAAGLLFGFVGAAAMAKQGDFAVTRLTISVPQTVLVVVIALAAGALASVLPGRRAAKATPVAALVEA